MRLLLRCAQEYKTGLRPVTALQHLEPMTRQLFYTASMFSIPPPYPSKTSYTEPSSILSRGGNNRVDALSGTQRGRARERAPIRIRFAPRPRRFIQTPRGTLRILSSPSHPKNHHLAGSSPRHYLPHSGDSPKPPDEYSTH